MSRPNLPPGSGQRRAAKIAQAWHGMEWNLGLYRIAPWYSLQSQSVNTGANALPKSICAMPTRAVRMPCKHIECMHSCQP